MSSLLWRWSLLLSIFHVFLGLVNSLKLHHSHHREFANTRAPFRKALHVIDNYDQYPPDHMQPFAEAYPYVLVEPAREADLGVKQLVFLLGGGTTRSFAVNMARSIGSFPGQDGRPLGDRYAAAMEAFFEMVADESINAGPDIPKTAFEVALSGRIFWPLINPLKYAMNGTELDQLPGFLKVELVASPREQYELGFCNARQSTFVLPQVLARR